MGDAPFSDFERVWYAPAQRTAGFSVARGRPHRRAPIVEKRQEEETG